MIRVLLAVFVGNTSIVPIDIERFNIPYFINNAQISTIYCHREVKEPLIKALECTRKAEKFHSTPMLLNFGGCYVPRKVHGTNKWSYHAWGAALDINVPRRASRIINNQHPELVKCFKGQGFIWGGDWTNVDYMHFEFPIKI